MTPNSGAQTIRSDQRPEAYLMAHCRSSTAPLKLKEIVSHDVGVGGAVEQESDDDLRACGEISSSFTDFLSQEDRG